MIRILIADDQPKVRHALRLILEQEAVMTVAGEAAEVEGILAQIKGACPAVVLLDWGLLGSEPIDRLLDLRQACPGLRVIVLSGQPGVEEDALAAGADVFVSKTDPPETLLAAITQVHQ
jgi:DNA-binding NarL/FixJ family response regulator